MDILLITLIFLVSFSLGSRLFRLMGVGVSSASEKIVFSVSLGMGVLAYIVFFLGIAGGAVKPLIGSVIAVIFAATCGELRSIFVHSKEAIRCFLRGLSVFDKIIIFFLGVTFLGTLIGALSPPIGHDSLSYRLAQVNIFSKSGRVDYIPYTRESLWPYLIEMLFTLGMVLRSDVSAKLIAWLFGIMAVLSVYTVARKYFSKTAALISASIFFLTPVIFQQITYAYVDIPMALFGFLALAGLMRFFEDHDSRWALIAGIFTGFMLSIKAIGIVVIPVFFLVVVYGIMSRRISRVVVAKSAAIFLFAVICFSGVWYLRAFLIKGNPVYPFFAHVFGGNGWAESLEGNIGESFSFLNYIKLPWDITLFPSKYGDEKFGLFYLLFLPLLVLLPWRQKRSAIFLVIFSGVYSFVWYYVDNAVSRFLIPAILPLSVLIGSVLVVGFSLGKFGKYLKYLLILILLFNTGVLVNFNKDRVAVALGLESRDDYLARTERTYEMAMFIRENIPEDAKILMVNEVRVYYFDRDYVHLRNFLEEERLSKGYSMKKDFLTELYPKGIEYILYRDGPGISKYPWLSILQEYYMLVNKTVNLDEDGGSFTYSLYKYKFGEND